jgi:hypothetical protein
MKAPTSIRLKADPTTRRFRSSDGLSPNCPRKERRLAPQGGLEPPTLRLTEALLTNHGVRRSATKMMRISDLRVARLILSTAVDRCN